VREQSVELKGEAEDTARSQNKQDAREMGLAAARTRGLEGRSN